MPGAGFCFPKGTRSFAEDVWLMRCVFILGLQRHIGGGLSLPRCMQQRGGVLGCVPDADKGPVAQLPPPPAHCVLQRCSLRCSSYFCAAALPSAAAQHHCVLQRRSLRCSCQCSPLQQCHGVLLQCINSHPTPLPAKFTVRTRFKCIRGGQWADCCRRGNSNTCSLLTTNTIQIHAHYKYN